MALLKSMELPNGLVVHYHNIVKVEIRPEQKTVRYMFAMYADEQKRIDGKPAAWYHDTFEVPFADFVNNPMRGFYKTATTHPSSPWLGAESTSDEEPLAPGEQCLSLVSPVVGTPATE